MIPIVAYGAGGHARGILMDQPGTCGIPMRSWPHTRPLADRNARGGEAARPNMSPEAADKLEHRPGFEDLAAAAALRDLDCHAERLAAIRAHRVYRRD